jgi:hypothetical protein
VFESHSRHGYLFVFILCLCEVAALQRADPPSRESYRLCKDQETEVKRSVSRVLYSKCEQQENNNKKTVTPHIFRAYHSHQDEQWSWCSPLTVIRIFGCVLVVRVSPSLSQSIATTVISLLFMRNVEAVSQMSVRIVFSGRKIT